MIVFRNITQKYKETVKSVMLEEKDKFVDKEICLSSLCGCMAARENDIYKNKNVGAYDSVLFTFADSSILFGYSNFLQEKTKKKGCSVYI